jgi:hypothetical protein
MREPPWEDEKAVAQWALAAIEEMEEPPNSPGRADDADRNAFVVADGQVKWREGWSYERWREIAFERAKIGDFDLLMQFIAFRPNHVSIDSTFEQREILTDFIAGRLKRRKRPRVLAPYIPDKNIRFDLLVAKALRIKSLLKRNYGQMKGINERVAFTMALRGSTYRKMLRYLEKGPSHRARKVPHDK